MPTPLRILDTNILVHYVRDDRTWARIRMDYQLLVVVPTPLISIVTAGELRSLARHRNWGRDKLDRMDFALGYFQIVPIDSPEQILIYSEIDNFCLERGRVMGKNDLWIAATAALTDARLLTSDADFELLDGVYLNLEWVRAPES